MLIEKKIKPEEGKIQTCYVQAILMANGEIICRGETLGWFKDLKNVLYGEKGKGK